MADIVGLLREHYDAKYGLVNVRPVIDQLLKSTPDAFVEMSSAFDTADPQWRLPILEAMRTLAAIGRCDERSAGDLLRATEAVAADSGVDEHFKTINALVTAQRTAGALTPYALDLLKRRGDGLARRLAFYTVAMLLEHGTAPVTASLRGALESAAATETSDQLKRQYAEIVARLR
jgi:hypothetical protein